MRRAITALIALAIVALAAGAVFATQQIAVDNVTQDPLFYPPGDPTDFNNVAATKDGALWLKTGSGAPVQWDLDQDINIQLLVDNPYDGNVWETIGTYLVSNGAQGATRLSGTTPPPPHSPTPACFFKAAPSIPDSNAITGPYNEIPRGLYFWTGTDNTYAQAYADAQAHTAGVYVGDSGVFTQFVPFSGGGPPPIPGDLTGMPATIMSQPAATPEPSTAILLGAGMSGLLAYAWRRRCRRA